MRSHMCPPGVLQGSGRADSTAHAPRCVTCWPWHVRQVKSEWAGVDSLGSHWALPGWPRLARTLPGTCPFLSSRPSRLFTPHPPTTLGPHSSACECPAGWLTAPCAWLCPLACVRCCGLVLQSCRWHRALCRCTWTVGPAPLPAEHRGPGGRSESLPGSCHSRRPSTCCSDFTCCPVAHPSLSALLCPCGCGY